MSKHTSPDVLIVGAGPTGLTLAIQLLRHQISCRLIDKLQEPRNTSRSFTVHARTLELFEHVGLAQSFLSDSHFLKGFFFNFKGKDIHPILDFSSLDTPYPYILSLGQKHTEERIRQFLADSFDFEPEWGTQLIHLSQDHDARLQSVKVTIKHQPDGSEETLHPKFVVGCDGSHSFVRTALGIDNVNSKYEGMIMQLMDAKVHNFHGTDEWIHYYMSKDSFFLLSKLPGDYHRIVISKMRKDIDPSNSQQQLFQQLLDEHLEKTTVEEPEWATKWQIWKRLAVNYSVGNVFLVGDAAHVHSPSGGQGMNVGIQDAVNLGWKLVFVLQGFAERKLLDSYERERKPIATQVIEGTDAMHNIIMAHGKGMQDRLDLTQAPGWHDSAVNRISGLSYHYRNTADLPQALALPGELQPGDRAPDRHVPGHGRLFDILKQPSMSALLLTTDSSPKSEVSYLCQVIESSFSHFMKLYVVHTENDDDNEFTQTYGRFDRGHLYVLRPDGYIFLHCSLDDISEFVDYMKHMFHVKEDSNINVINE